MPKPFERFRNDMCTDASTGFLVEVSRDIELQTPSHIIAVAPKGAAALYPNYLKLQSVVAKCFSHNMES